MAPNSAFRSQSFFANAFAIEKKGFPLKSGRNSEKIRNFCIKIKLKY
jgi:hypothetical protein